ncbi:hypothetical protein K435DRAFT_879929 [Dendrothele bispora CBS 962.96]|uniref:WD40 repeat-like protein n=1 Tax=Dendrothele bispora (strain CBS 962.96) TaxID=1314807 RepID=A0A4S8KKB5_DENBC|nr:hypothetical protein K435DRAFT_879988 [Dendrothele bispora CBS 962.96]THU75956.1 hypothetical protein K435DRAFT_879929 [Dendrothele bispora CBS 962.96]
MDATYLRRQLRMVLNLLQLWPVVCIAKPNKLWVMAKRLVDTPETVQQVIVSPDARCFGFIYSHSLDIFGDSSDLDVPLFQFIDERRITAATWAISGLFLGHEGGSITSLYLSPRAAVPYHFNFRQGCPGDITSFALVEDGLLAAGGQGIVQFWVAVANDWRFVAKLDQEVDAKAPGTSVTSIRVVENGDALRIAYKDEGIITWFIREIPHRAYVREFGPDLVQYVYFFI